MARLAMRSCDCNNPAPVLPTRPRAPETALKKSGINSCLSKIMLKKLVGKLRGKTDRGVTDSVGHILSAGVQRESLRSVWDEGRQT